MGFNGEIYGDLWRFIGNRWEISMVIYGCLPFGYVKIAIEHGHRHIGFTH